MSSARPFVAALVALVALALAAPAGAQDTPALSAGTPSVTLDERGAGEVTLTNETALDLTIALAVVGDDGSRVPNAVGDLATGPRLGPGETATVTVTVPDAPAESVLVVRAAPTGGLPRGAVLRVPVTKLAPPKPAVKAWTIMRKHAGSDEGERLPLTQPCGGLNLTKPKELGTVQAGGHSLTVTGSCPDKSAKWLELSPTHRPSDGRSYTGTIKIGEDEVELTVEDTLVWTLAALIILGGIGLALFANLWPGGGRAIADLRRRSYVVEALVDPDNELSADRSFASAAERVGLPANVQEWRIGPEVRRKLIELRGSLHGFPEAEALEEAEKELESLETEVRNWHHVANELGDLKHRIGTLSDLEKYVDAVRKRTLDREGPLDLDAMSDVKAATSEALLLATDWPSETIAAARARAAALPESHDARQGFDAFVGRLRGAGTAAAAREALESFWAVNEALHKAGTRTELLTGPPMKRFLAEAEAAGWAGFFQPVETDDPTAAARDIGRRIAFVDAAVLVALLSAALVAGMQELWVGQSFGGFWDIAAAFVWGLGSGTIAAPLTTALTDFGRSWLAARR